MIGLPRLKTDDYDREMMISIEMVNISSHIFEARGYQEKDRDFWTLRWGIISARRNRRKPAWSKKMMIDKQKRAQYLGLDFCFW